MGWKTVRDHYRIEHIVRMEGGDLHVGSGYVGNVIVVTPDGVVSIHQSNPGREYVRIAQEMRADTEQLVALMRADDVFERAVRVYTWAGGEILERFCEETGWPNVTHDGEVMYENRYSEDRDEVLGWARDNAAATVEGYRRMVEDARRDLAVQEDRLAQALDNQAALAAVRPISA